MALAIAECLSLFVIKNADSLGAGVKLVQITLLVQKQSSQLLFLWGANNPRNYQNFRGRNSRWGAGVNIALDHANMNCVELYPECCCLTRVVQYPAICVNSFVTRGFMAKEAIGKRK